MTFYLLCRWLHSQAHCVCVLSRYIAGMLSCTTCTTFALLLSTSYSRLLEYQNMTLVVLHDLHCILQALYQSSAASSSRFVLLMMPVPITTRCCICSNDKTFPHILFSISLARVCRPLSRGPRPLLLLQPWKETFRSATNRRL